MEMRHSCAIPKELKWNENHFDFILILFSLPFRSNYEKITLS